MKKKIVVAVSVLSLLASPVYASEFDVENMSQDELKDTVI